MEENKSKKSGGVSLVLVIAILVIVLVGCITYIVKINEKELAINNDNNEKTVSELKIEIANLKYALENKTMTNDEKYEVFLRNLKKSVTDINKYSNIEESYSIIGEDEGYTIKLNSKCELSVHFTDKKTEKKFGTDKLSTDVLAFNNCYVGNGGMRLLYFIKSDGTLWVADIEGCLYSEETKISTQKLSEYKNIISVLNFYSADSDEFPGAMSPLFVDIDGNIYGKNK